MSGDKPRHDYDSQAERLMAELMAEKVPPATKRPIECPHEDFAAAVAVARLTDSGTICAEVRITCVNCHLPMRFVGLPAGWHPEQPTVSIDGLELHAPLEPESVKLLASQATFTMPRIPEKH